ncbi:DNA primase family protein [Roseiconus lacunae]|uniref:DNA primase family protein n=1 Tax=Roseiconus lacunae TaxID=2605694 RepID=UPI001E64479C|nr:phage/plasmid primase, P4 family [Roseiconus lacunae]MCD0459138.1 phage/plasmid primase, P4 family [Roseiconus lacunae]
MGFGYAGKLIEESDQVVWKCEGLSDVLSLLSLGLPDHHTAVTNGCGATERPAKSNEWFSRKLSGKEVFVVHDCDRPGQDGAIGDDKKPGWAPAIARHAAIVRNVILPYPVAQSHGKDLRDWIGDRRSEGKDNPTIYAELIDYARRAKQIHPLGADLPAETEADRSGDFAADDSRPDAANQDDKDAKKPLEHPDDPHRLARINLARYQDEHSGALRYWQGQWWKYREGRYRLISIDELKAKVNSSIKAEFDSLWEEENDTYEWKVTNDWFEQNGEKDKGPPKVRKVNSKIVNDVIGAMESACVISGQIKMPSWLPSREERSYLSIQNGILDIDAYLAGKDENECLLDHSQDWFSNRKIGISLHVGSSCPLFKDFITSAMEGDQERIAILQEWMGYVLLSKNPFQKFLALEGVGGDGKTTYCNAICAMLGKSNVSTLPLSKFNSNFGLSSTMGRMVNICGEVGSEPISESDLKQYTGGDSMHFDRKYKEAESEMPSAKLMMSWNDRPHFRDKTRAIWRRMILVPFKRTVPDSEIIEGMDSTDYWVKNNETGGMLCWAIEGLERLMRNKKFTESKLCEEAKSDMIREVNPARAFLDEHVVLLHKAKIGKQELYEHYVRYCNERGHRYPLSNRSFGKEVCRVFPEIEMGKVDYEFGSRKNAYINIEYREEEYSEDERKAHANDYKRLSETQVIPGN